jgi:hypothetical protein
MKNLIIYALCLGTTYLALGQEEKGNHHQGHLLSQWREQPGTASG